MIKWFFENHWTIANKNITMIQSKYFFLKDLIYISGRFHWLHFTQYVICIIGESSDSIPHRTTNGAIILKMFEYLLNWKLIVWHSIVWFSFSGPFINVDYLKCGFLFLLSCHIHLRSYLNECGQQTMGLRMKAIRLWNENENENINGNCVIDVWKMKFEKWERADTKLLHIMPISGTSIGI